MTGIRSLFPLYRAALRREGLLRNALIEPEGRLPCTWKDSLPTANQSPRSGNAHKQLHLICLYQRRLPEARAPASVAGCGSSSLPGRTISDKVRMQWILNQICIVLSS